MFISRPAAAIEPHRSMPSSNSALPGPTISPSPKTIRIRKRGSAGRCGSDCISRELPETPSCIKRRTLRQNLSEGIPSPGEGKNVSARSRQHPGVDSSGLRKWVCQRSRNHDLPLIAGRTRRSAAGDVPFGPADRRQNRLRSRSRRACSRSARLSARSRFRALAAGRRGHSPREYRPRNRRKAQRPRDSSRCLRA